MNEQQPTTRARGTFPFYVAALGTMAVSINTSWRFFGERLHIPMAYNERPLMFAVLELGFIACAWAMRASVRQEAGKPGPARWVAWGLCAFAAYMAIDLSGLAEGIARVALGPVLGLIFLHLALGIEVRVAHGAGGGTWARIGRELRERMLDRFGLADDDRDARARTMDRAADRAARLTTARWAFRRDARVAKAMRVAQVAIDPVRQDRMLSQVAVAQNVRALRGTRYPAPWEGWTPAPLRTGPAIVIEAAQAGLTDRPNDRPGPALEPAQQAGLTSGPESVEETGPGRPTKPARKAAHAPAHRPARAGTTKRPSKPARRTTQRPARAVVVDDLSTDDRAALERLAEVHEDRPGKAAIARTLGVGGPRAGRLAALVQGTDAWPLVTPAQAGTGPARINGSHIDQ